MLKQGIMEDFEQKARVIFTHDAWNFRAGGVLGKKRGKGCPAMAGKWSFLTFGIILAEIKNQIELTLATSSKQCALHWQINFKI
jgi:hypothetical protein